MPTSRLEAFTDGIFAIAITILVLNLPIPKTGEFIALTELKHSIITYLFCFILIAIYWNNHHHLFQITKQVNGITLWVNTFFLFFVTLLPFSAVWLSNYFIDQAPQFIFGFNILLMDFTFLLILLAVKKANLCFEDIYPVINKTKFTIVMNIIAIVVGYFILPVLTIIINMFVIVLWILPEKTFSNKTT